MGRERLGFGLLIAYLLGFFLAPSSEAGQNVAHDAIFYFGLLPWALTLGLWPGLQAIRHSRLLWLAVALAVYLLASSAWSRGDLELPAADAALQACATLGFLVAATGLLDPARTERLLDLLERGGALAAALALLAFAGGRSYVGSGRLHSALNFEHPNLFAHALGFAALLALDRWLRGDRPRAALGALGLLVPALLLTRGRLALLAFLLGAGVLLACRGGRRGWLALGGLAVTLAAARLGARHVAAGFFERGDAGRGFLYSSLLDRASAHPLFGLGLLARDDVAFAPGSGDFPGGIVLSHAHSAFLATFFFGGLLGLGVLLALAGLGLRRGLHLARAGAPLPLALLAFGLACLLFDGHRVVGRPHLTSFLLLWLPLVLVARWPWPAASPRAGATVSRAPAWHPAVVALAALLLLAVRLPRLSGPVDEPQAWRQLDALQVARSYLESGVDLARPEVAWRGPRGSAVLDFPLAEALWSLLFRIGGERPELARVVQLAAFAGALGLLAGLARALGLHGAAIWAVLLAGGAPLAILHSRSLLPEQLALAAGLGGALAGLRYLDGGRTTAATAAFLLLCLALLLAPHWSFGWLIFLGLASTRATRRRAAVLGGLLLAALALGAAYQVHAWVASAAPWPSWAPGQRPTSPWLGALGWPDRISDLRQMGARILGDLIGLPLLLPAAAALVLALHRGPGRLLLLVGAHALGLLLHLRGAALRDHDLLPLLVPLSLLAGLGLTRIAGAGGAGRWLAGAALALTFADNVRRAEARLEEARLAARSERLRAVADLVGRETPPGAVVAFSAPGLGPRCPLLLVPARRRGYMVPADRLRAGVVSELESAGVSHLAVVTEGPLPAEQASALLGHRVRRHELAPRLVVYVSALAEPLRPAASR